MSQKPKDSIRSMPGERTIEDGLFDKDPRVAIMSRMAASQFATSFAEFLGSEIRRGNNPVDLLEALAMFQVQAHASLAANFMGEGGFEATLQLYLNILVKTYVMHARNCSAANGFEGGNHDRPH